MKVHPITLFFYKKHKDLEPEYRAKHFENSINIQRLSIFLFLILYALFGLLDALVAEKSKNILWMVRFFFICPYSIGLLLISHTAFFKKYDNLLLSIMLSSGGIGISLMMFYSDPPAAYTYYAGNILILIGSYTFLRIRFTWALFCGFTVILSYEIVAFYIKTPVKIMISNNFFFISANLVCLISGYYREKTFRGNFFLNYMLDSEKERVAEKNEELKKRIRAQHEAEEALIKKNHEIEKIVIERTKELVKSKDGYRELVENLNDLIFETDSKGVFTYVSPVVETMFGYSPDNLKGRELKDFIHVDYKEKIKRLITDNIDKESNSGEFLFRTFSGDERWVTVSIRRSKINDTNSSIHGLIRDITNERQLELKLRHAQKMEAIGTLAGGIAHDFNNFLFPIIGYSELILTDMEEDNPLTPKIKNVHLSALRAKELVRQILAFSTNHTREYKPLKIQPVLNEALTLLRSTIPKTVEIKSNIDNNCGEVKADSIQIHQIIINLITNSYHAMEADGGELTVSLEEKDIKSENSDEKVIKSGSYAVLTVSDQGEGIQEEMLEKIFDPFFTTKEQGKGTGMGLSVVHGIVKSMNGVIKVESEPDKGTEIKIYLPVEKNKENTSEDIISGEDDVRGGNETILLVDDEEVILETENDMLLYLGYNVVASKSSPESLEIFRNDPQKFDLVITDLAMPSLSGDKLAKELKKIREDIPVLMCTGYNEKIKEEMAEESGIKGILIKPVVLKELADKIREILDS